MLRERAVIEWLLDSDPSIRWQVMRDLTNEPDEVVAAQRSRVGSEGWGARLLALQAPEGRWWADTDPWPLKGTIFTLVLLKDLGLDPSSEEARSAIGRVREGKTWHPFAGRPFFDGETEACINGRILEVGAYFGHSSDQLLQQLLGEQLGDGGWNCDAPQSQRSSFHSTICVLEGLLEYERARDATVEVTEARVRAQEYLLERRMFRSLSTGNVIDCNWMRFSFPPTYHYDVLRGLDYLRSAGVEPDERVAEAIDLVAKKQNQNGRWPLENPHPDRVPLDMEGGPDTPSRWNTLRALRVLHWYAARD
jgi:hypothetical protein